MNVACDCGNHAVIDAAEFFSGGTKSCGCLRLRHGMHGTPEYLAWSQAKSRCSSPSNRQWKDYGGRGIRMCERWSADFREFFEDMGPRPGPRYSLDRIDNDGDYAPGNCRWATDIEQLTNRRSVAMYALDGVTMSMAGWSRRTGIPYQTIRSRLARGWTFRRAVESPSVGGGAPRGQGAKVYTCNGRTATVREWSEITGIPESTIHARLQRGWTPERAVTVERGRGFGSRPA